MIAFSILSEDVKQIQVWKPTKKIRAFCCIPDFGVFKNMHFCTFLLNLSKKNIDLLFTKSRPLTWYYVLKVYLKKIYTYYYFIMRKILTGAKLLLKSIYRRNVNFGGNCHY